MMGVSMKDYLTDDAGRVYEWTMSDINLLKELSDFQLFGCLHHMLARDALTRDATVGELLDTLWQGMQKAVRRVDDMHTKTEKMLAELQKETREQQRREAETELP